MKNGEPHRSVFERKVDLRDQILRRCAFRTVDPIIAKTRGPKPLKLLPWHPISEKSRDLQDLMYLRIHHGPANPDFFHCWRTLTTFTSTGFCKDGVEIDLARGIKLVATAR
jgi:hypothetical protein